MEPGLIDKFKTEQLLGNKAQHSYDEFVKGFLTEKRAGLFVAFQELPMANKDDIMEVKRMLSVLDRLEMELLNIIDTGLLASESLKDEGGVH